MITEFKKCFLLRCTESSVSNIPPTVMTAYEPNQLLLEGFVKLMVNHCVLDQAFGDTGPCILS